MDGLVQPRTQLVDLRLHDAQDRVDVEVGGAGQQRLDADAVEGAGGIGAHPAVVDQGLQQRVHAAPRRIERVAEIAEPGRLMASCRQQFEHLDRARGGLDLANAPTVDPLGAVRVARVVFGHWDLSRCSS